VNLQGKREGRNQKIRGLMRNPEDALLVSASELSTLSPDSQAE
jgi:hypothetical protein